jgi:fructoselysine-6-P-deglycase FrlB-like protein
MEHEGLRLMTAEMARQCGDALLTLDDSRGVAAEIAGAIQTVRRLVLYGIGGTHYVNRIVEPLYREAGIEGSVAKIALMSKRGPKIFSETFNERFQVAPF